MEVAVVLADLQQMLLRLLQPVHVLGGLIAAQVVDDQRNDLLSRVDQRHAAVGQLCHRFRVEQQVEGVQRHVAKPFLHFLDVDADAVGAPLPDRTIFQVGIDGADPVHQHGVQIGEIGDLRLVEFLYRARLYQTSKRRHGSRDHQVIAGTAGQQLGLQHVIGIIDVVIDLGACLGGEIG